MRRCLTTLVILALAFPIWGASASAMAASETNQQATTKSLELDQVNEGDRITIYEKSGRILDLIVTEISATEQPALESDISGTYVSDITGNFGGNRKLTITLKQSGKDIIGTDVSLRKIVIGTSKEDTIKFEYLGRGDNITGKWKINSDGTKLEGKWDTSGRWGNPPEK